MGEMEEAVAKKMAGPNPARNQRETQRRRSQLKQMYGKKRARKMYGDDYGA